MGVVSSHECPAKGCDEAVPVGQLSCRRDWYRLPTAIRQRVGRAYRTAGPGSGEHTDAVVEALDWYAAQPDPQPKPEPLPGILP